MSLSERARKFLQKSERDCLPFTEQDIYKAFNESNVPVYQPLIDFQLNYGGYIFYAGLVSIKYTLLFALGNKPLGKDSCGIDVIESELDSPEYYFTCAKTDYQMSFSLDEEGIYYEDGEPVASSFENYIENHAIWDEMNAKGGFEVICRDKKLATKELDKVLDLQIMPEASDEFTLWFCNDLVYLQYWQGLATLMVHNSYPDINTLRAL